MPTENNVSVTIRPGVPAFRAFEANPDEVTLDGIRASLDQHLPQAVRVAQIEALLARLDHVQQYTEAWGSKIGKTHGVTCRRTMEAISATATGGSDE